MGEASSIVILTGAGISAESGVDTFRDKDGIWSRYDLNEVATPEGFARNPGLVHDFYNERRHALLEVKPNAAHLALAGLQREFSGDLLLVTQNIDDLHERAGSTGVVHMHGELKRALCGNCGNRSNALEPMSRDLPCPACATPGYMRPDVVWFGEMPYHMERIYEALAACDLFLSIGTSGNVYPAAQFVDEAARSGARTLELNLEPSSGVNLFDDAVHGKAGTIVPEWVERFLGESRTD